MFYLKLIWIGLSIAIACFIGFFACLIRWGDPNLNRDISHWMSRLSFFPLGVKVEIEGAERLDQAGPCIFVGNHQSNFDSLVMGEFFPKRTLIIGKKELLYLPFFGIAYVAAGNFLIDRKNRSRAIAGLHRAIRRMKDENNSVIMFPEGTRNKSGEGLLPFKKGAFHMAISAQVPIVPFVMSPIKPVFDWQGKKAMPGTIRVRVLEPVETKGYSTEQVDELSGIVREEMIKAIRGLSTQVS